ncbi:round spermatid basic protein 1-like protein [Caerostris extrusa]|uniref:Round spermatid basic protein 1-like protein n=1 Tax=Caerostris extrusa TaxID=172846 RepID=A0AAV4YBM9_CAEEX|nr:round spermatid basic protein 1-like protein [Caerostris extrusa]
METEETNSTEEVSLKDNFLDDKSSLPVLLEKSSTKRKRESVDCNGDNILISDQLSCSKRLKFDSPSTDPHIKTEDTSSVNNLIASENNDVSSKPDSFESNTEINESITEQCENPTLSVNIDNSKKQTSLNLSVPETQNILNNVINCDTHKHLKTEEAELFNELKTPVLIKRSLRVSVMMYLQRIPRLPQGLDMKHLKYGKYIRLEVYPNGGAALLHLYWDEICHLNSKELKCLAEEFLKETFLEEPYGVARYVMGIVHNAAEYIPDLLEHFADKYPNLVVKTGPLGRQSDIETTTMVKYCDQVHAHYSQGTFRAGPFTSNKSCWNSS